MKKLVLVVLVTVLVSCSKSEEPQDIPGAIQAIMTDSAPDCNCLPFINQYSWRGKLVFVLAYRGPACNWMPAYFDRNGNTITMESNYSYDDFLVEAFFLGEVWKCQ